MASQIIEKFRAESQVPCVDCGGGPLNIEVAPSEEDELFGDGRYGADIWCPDCGRIHACARSDSRRILFQTIGGVDYVVTD